MKRKELRRGLSALTECFRVFTSLSSYSESAPLKSLSVSDHCSPHEGVFRVFTDV